MTVQTTTHYHIGWNIPGYLPEMDPWMVQDAEEAKRVLIHEMEYQCDHYDSLCEGECDTDEWHGTANELSALEQDLNLANVDQGWDGYTDRLHYWIMPCAEECEEESW